MESDLQSIIDDFDASYWFLSNFTFSPFVLHGKSYDTVEHYFQSMKTTDLNSRESIRKSGHPRFAKKFGRQVHLREDWEKIKYSVMYMAVKAKFEQNPNLAELLKATAPAYLIEGNTWHDNIWGDCRCSKCKGIMGQNLLGKILMRIRDEISECKA